MERCGENSRTSYILSTTSDGDASFTCFPQLQDHLKPRSSTVESRFLNISTHSTTTKFFKKVVFFYIGTVHNQAYMDAVEAR